MTRQIAGYGIAEQIAADCLFEAQGDAVKAQRLARDYIVGEEAYEKVAALIRAAAERVTIPRNR
jgi:hypothetical protein